MNLVAGKSFSDDLRESRRNPVRICGGIQRVNRFVERYLLVLVALLGVLVWPVCAQTGLDLRKVDFERTGSFVLDAGWALYPGKLLKPEDLDRSGVEPDLSGVRLPLVTNHWQTDNPGRPESRTLTLVLRLRMPESGGRYALRLGNVGAAYRLWLNGELRVSQGRVGENGSDASAEYPQLGVRLLEFQNDGSPIELVMEVSNHLSEARWLIDPVIIGLADEVLATQNRQWGGAHFFAGCLLMMGCYHLLFFSFRRQNPGPLYFGMYCLLWVLSFAASTSSDWFVLLYFPCVATIGAIVRESGAAWAT